MNYDNEVTPLLSKPPETPKMQLKNQPEPEKSQSLETHKELQSVTVSKKSEQSP